MRRNIMWIAATTALIVAPACVRAQQTSQSGQSGQTQEQSRANTQAGPAPSFSAQPGSVAEAARKARQDKKSAQKIPVVFTNENLPRSSAISVVGATGPEASSASMQAEAAADEKSDEKMWRQKFADARAKLRQDREKLATLKSDLNALGMVRYFNEHDAVSKQQAVIDEENQINADQKAIDDLEDALRKANGDSAWAR